MAQEPSIDQLKQQQDETLRQLGASSTATGKGTPSTSDIANQQKLLTNYEAIKRARNKQLQADWYGDDEDRPEREGAESGFLAKTFDTMLRPLYGVVGGVDYLTGRSGSSSFSKAVSENAKEKKRTFGNVLKDSGAPGTVSAPLGLALDIAFDPVNWFTFGTAALLPRVVFGLGKGTVKGGITQGLKAAKLGATSKIYKGAAMTGSLANTTAKIPGVVTRAASKLKNKALKTGEIAVDVTPKAVTPAVRKLREKALRAADEYDHITGRDVIKMGENSGVPLLESIYQLRLGEKIEEVAMKTPWLKGWYQYFNYDPSQWHRTAKMKDALTQVSGGGAEMKAGLRAFIKEADEGVPYQQALKESRKARGLEERVIGATGVPESRAAFNLDEIAESVGRSGVEIPESAAKQADLLKQIQTVAKDNIDIIGNPNKFISHDHVENMLRLASEQSGFKIGLDDIKEIMKHSNGETGWIFFDRLKNRMISAKQELRVGKRSVRIGKAVEKTLDAIAGFITIFKRMKVGGSGPAWTNAIVGNASMAKMMGFEITDPMFVARLKESAKLARGKNPKEEFLRGILEDPNMLKAFAEMPDTIKATTGLNKTFIDQKYYLSRMETAARDGGLIADNVDIDLLAKSLGHAGDEIRSVWRDVAESSMKSPQKQAQLIKVAREAGKDVKHPLTKTELAKSKGLPYDPSDAQTSFAGSEFFESEGVETVSKYVAKRAKEGNPAFKIINFTLNDMSRGYEKIDQAFKSGAFFFASLDGVSEASFRIIARNVRVTADDVKKVKGRYVFTPDKALEIANETYLNYQAMPAAVKVIRSLPLVGFPFASFTYGMGLKTAKTFAYNPSLFNKVNLGLDEFSGDASPLERGVMDQPRYDFLKEPGMIKIPGTGSNEKAGANQFFQDHSLYLNATQMIPYLTLNMFTPANRKYEDVYTEKIVGALDKLPFMKGPLGSTIFDFIILPSIIRDERPQGQFGQPLYPESDTALDKARRALYQSTIDPLTPGIIAPIGFPLGKALPEGLIDYYPTYTLRKSARAARGESPIGLTGKESTGFKSLRALLSTFGVPLQSSVDFKYLPKDLEEQVKKSQNK